MMLFKLAFRNVRKSFKDYGIYFLTLMFGVCIFYIFNSIESQQSMMKISESQLAELRTLNRIMGYVSVFVSVVLAFLILYANRFIVKRRKKEFGIYETLGMRKGSVSSILIIETFFVALFSLVAGLLLGILLSQGFAVITASLFEVKLIGFVFIFSPSATIKAVTYFGIAFLLVMIFNSITISKQKLIDLIYADRMNETFKTPHLILSVLIFIISIICLLVAYHIIIENGLLYINKKFWTSILLGIFGTFLFFFSLSGFFLKVVQQNKKIYLKNLNMFVLRQINSKINTTYVSMTFVCLMLFISICSLSSGMGISKSMTAKLDELTPYDATYELSIWNVIYDDITGYSEFINYDINLIEEFMNCGIDIMSYASEIQEVKFYDATILFFEFSELDFIPYRLMKLSDYNLLLKMQGMEPVTLFKNEFMINCNNELIKDDIMNFIADNENGIVLYDTKLSFKHLYETIIYNMNSKNDDAACTFIVADEMLNGDEMKSSNLILVNYIESTEKYNQLFEKACDQVWTNIRDRLNTDENDSLRDRLNIDENHSLSMSIARRLKINIFQSNKSTSATIAYLAVYIGIVFLIISAAVLAIAQLSEASDNVKRYSLLRKIGTDGNMLNKALVMQIAVYFGMPLLLAIIHSIVGIKVASNIIKEIGNMNVLRDSIFAAVVIIVIYGGYFISTYLGCKSIVNKK